MSKNFQVLIAFVENNEMSFVSSSRVENLNERRRDKENTNLSLILLDADRLWWSLLSERVVARSDSCEDWFIRDTCDFTNVARICMHIRCNDEARRGLSAASEMQFARVQTHVCIVHTRTCVYALARLFLCCVPAHFFRRFVTKRTRRLALHISSSFEFARSPRRANGT